MLTNALVAAFGLLLTAITLLYLAGRITVKQYAGWMTIVYTVAGVLAIAAGWQSTSYIIAGGTALFARLWWHSGGGAGTRRRLKSWASRFRGVRRTAPQGA
jgi:hypothetical protein